MLNYPQVALGFMNRDHAEFAALRDKLLALLAQQASDTGVDALLAELFEHTRRHFAEEERQMQAAQFPPYPMHKMEHDRVLADLAGHIAHWQQRRDVPALKSYLEATLAHWFVNHVSTMDSVTARFIASQQPNRNA